MPQKKRLVLGSSSEGRRKVLEELRSELTFTVMSPNIDESKIRRKDPADLTIALALAKAGAVITRFKEPCVIITSDQVVVYDGVIREKPRNAAEARMFLRSYGSGLPVRHVTSVCVTEYVPGERLRQKTVVDEAYVDFMPIPESGIKAAIERGVVLTCSGAVAIEDPDISPHIKRMRNAFGPPDARTSVMGLPRFRTLELLREFGVF